MADQFEAKSIDIADIKWAKKGSSMIDLSVAQRQALQTYRARLSRVKNGEVWDSDHPGPYTEEEKACEMTRIKTLIAKVEAGDA